MFAVAARLQREQAGLSQRDATRRLSWPQGKLSRIESGDRAKLPSEGDVAALDALYRTGDALLRTAGYVRGDLDETLRGIIDAHSERLYEDLREAFT